MKNKIQLVLHLSAWIIIFILPTYLLYLDSMDDLNFLLRSLFQIALFILIFYLNLLWFAPKYFFRSNKAKYFIIAVSTIIISTLVYNTYENYFFETNKKQPPNKEFFKMPPPPNSLSFRKMPHPSKSWPIYNFALNALLISGFGLGLKISEKLIKNEQIRKEAEKEKLVSELAFLKNQVSPHFFFNTLNNIYTLIEIDRNDAQKSVLQLSKLMRYLLYESESGNTTISKEIEFMKNYIELMKLRLSKNVSVNINFAEIKVDIDIPPLLFIPYIENAFKHGVSNIEYSFIDVFLRIENNEIIFVCKNSMFNKNFDLNTNNSGIGHENAKKRLNLLFKDKYELNINHDNRTFNVSLKILLDKV